MPPSSLLIPLSQQHSHSGNSDMSACDRLYPTGGQILSGQILGGLKLNREKREKRGGKGKRQKVKTKKTKKKKNEEDKKGTLKDKKKQKKSKIKSREDR